MSSEKDYINALDRYEDIKEIADLCEDVKSCASTIMPDNMTECSNTFKPDAEILC